MQDFSLHILDLMENSVAAGACNILLQISENQERDVMEIIIEDDGRGMKKKERQKVLDPFYTTRTTRKVGLGLPLFADRARETGGKLTIESWPGEGTRITGIFGWSHWDRPPLGDMASTIVTFLQGNPQIDIKYCHRVNDRYMELNTREYREVLDDVSLNHPQVLEYIREYIIGQLNLIRPNT